MSKDDPQSPAELKADIERTRGELGDTVEALVHKADVPARVKESAHESAVRVKETAQEGVTRVKETAQESGQQHAEELHQSAQRKTEEAKEAIQNVTPRPES